MLQQRGFAPGCAPAHLRGSLAQSRFVYEDIRENAVGTTLTAESGD